MAQPEAYIGGAAALFDDKGNLTPEWIPAFAGMTIEKCKHSDV